MTVTDAAFARAAAMAFTVTGTVQPMDYDTENPPPEGFLQRAAGQMLQHHRRLSDEFVRAPQADVDHVAVALKLVQDIAGEAYKQGLIEADELRGGWDAVDITAINKASADHFVARSQRLSQFLQWMENGVISVYYGVDSEFEKRGNLAIVNIGGIELKEYTVAPVHGGTFPSAGLMAQIILLLKAGVKERP